MSATFRLDPILAQASADLGSLELCDVRIQIDARFPWLILVPRREAVFEILDLSAAERGMLIEEIAKAGAALKGACEALGRGVCKLNVGALGNVVKQLHVHLVARFSEDEAWPEPVWGRGTARPYDPGDLQRLTEGIKARLWRG